MGRPAEVGRPPRWAVAGLLLTSLLAWGWLHRYWFPAGDDYLFVTDGTSPYGAFSAGYWWDTLRDDWLHRNGRLADAVLRLVLRPGKWFYPLFGPVMITACGALLTVVARHAAGLKFSPLWLWVSGLGTVPFVCWLVGAMTGDVVLWTAGAINYVLPLTTLLGALAIIVALLGGQRLPWALVVLGCVLVALTDALQEVTSAAMVCVAIALIVLRRGRLGGRLWALTATALAAFALHMSAPGLWNRSDLIVTNTGRGFLEATLRGMAASAAELWLRTQVVWIVLAAVLAVHAVGSMRSRMERATLLAAMGACVTFMLASTLYLTRLPLTPEPRLALVLAVSGTVILAFLAVGLALLQSRARLGEGVTLVWVAFVGSCVFPFAAGTTGPRVHLVAIVLLLLFLVVLLAGWVDQLTPAQALAASLVGVGIPAGVWFDETRVSAAANNLIVTTQIVAPLEAAARGEVHSVELPASLPYPAYTYWAAFKLDRYGDALRVYYGVPDTVSITNG